MGWAVGRVTLREGGAVQQRGTAFAVAPDLALTAFHCVGDKKTGRLLSGEVTVVLQRGRTRIAAQVQEWDADADFAVLRLSSRVPSALALVRLHAACEPFEPIRCLGYPGDLDIRDGRLEAPTVTGQVSNPEGDLDGVPVIELLIDQAVAGLSLHGYSGAPILSGRPEAAIGIMRWNPERRSAPGRAVGAIAVACPLAVVLDQCGYLRSLAWDRAETTPTLPPKCPELFGRAPLLSKLRRDYETARKRRTTAVHVVTGASGTGKTQLARWYCHEYDDRYQRVAWIPATEPAEARQRYAGLAGELGLAVALNAQTERVIEEVRLALASMTGWLLVFDDAKSPADIRYLIPEGRDGHVLITSQKANEWRLTGRVIGLTPLSVAAAARFLSRATGDSDQEAAYDIAKWLGCIPGFLAQAAAHCDRSGLSLAVYRGRLESGRWGGSMTAPTDHPKLIDAVWSEQLAAVEREPAAALFLRLAPFLDGNRIPRWLFTDPAGRFDPLMDTEELDRAVGTLLNHSLVNADRGQIAMHQLLQAFLRERLGDEASIHSRQVVELLRARFPARSRLGRYYSPKDQLIAVELLAHALGAVQHDEHYAKDGRLESASLLDRIGAYLRSRGDPGAASVVDTQALEIRQKVLDPGHPDVAVSLNNLGADATELGRPLDAELLDRRAMDLALAAADHPRRGPRLAGYLSDLAMDLVELDRPLAALPLMRRAVALKSRCEGPRHPDLPWLFLNLASVFLDVGRVEEALVQAQRARELGEDLFGNEDPDRIRALCVIGKIHRRTSNPGRALLVDREALDIAERLLDPNHQLLGRALNSVGQDWLALGRPDLSLPFLERALSVARSLRLAPQHRNVREWESSLQSARDRLGNPH